MSHLINIMKLEDLIERYHGRDGTFNFHNEILALAEEGMMVLAPLP